MFISFLDVISALVCLTFSFVRCVHLDFSAFACEAKADHCQVPLDRVATVGFVDYNVPVARQSKAAQTLVSAMSIANDTGDPSRNCCLMILPDLPKESSLRGLFDEEKAILEGCFGMKQDVETRWIDLYCRDRRGESKANSRRFGSGRIRNKHMAAS